jgi:hypothetical protein
MNNKLIVGATGVLLAVAAFVAGSYVDRASQSSGSLNDMQPSPVDEQRAPSGSAKLYGKLISADSNLTFQLVEWVRGADNQEQAALETGRCTLARVENDECVPNGFFVRDTGKQLTLPLSADAKIEVYARNGEGMASDASGNGYLQMVNASELAKLIGSVGSLKQIPFILTTEHGKVIGVREQYIP